MVDRVSIGDVEARVDYSASEENNMINIVDREYVPGWVEAGRYFWIDLGHRHGDPSNRAEW